VAVNVTILVKLLATFGSEFTNNSYVVQVAYNAYLRI